MTASVKSKKKMTKGEQTRKLLREGVRNLLSQRELADVAIEDIVDETGVSIGSIYFHYKNKDVLFHAVAEEDIEAFFDYFARLEDEKAFFDKAFLYNWRSMQQVENRLGSSQLTIWHLYQNHGEEPLSWQTGRLGVVNVFSAAIAMEQGSQSISQSHRVLAEILVSSTEQLHMKLATKEKVETFEGMKPKKIATDLAVAWTKTVIGDVPSEAAIKTSTQRIIRETRQLQRPFDLNKTE